MINKVVFFNFYHNGDIHISRSLVRFISKICTERGIQCEYYHKNNPHLLDDIKTVTHTSNNYSLHDKFPSSIVGDTVFINTWYCANIHIFHTYIMTFDCVYYNFRDAAKLLDIDLDQVPILELFPSIDFDYFEIAKAKQWLSEHNHPRVFVSNGQVLSGQAHNFSFAPIINTLAQQYTNIDFLLSNAENGLVSLPNIFLTSDIIQKNSFDLNENSYVASNCQLIIGRCSGTHSFAITRENYWEKPKTFLAFSNLAQREVVWAYQLTPPVLAQITNNNVFDHRVIDIIRSKLPVL